MGIFDGKVAIVSGGGASIGAGIVRKLHAEGARVFIADINAAKGEALASELGAGASFVATDITGDAALDALIDRVIGEADGVDILVNNACSYGDDGPATTRATWLATLDVSAVSAAILGEKLRPHLKARCGVIVNIGSVSGVFPHVGRWAYPVAKAALRHLSKAQALDYAADGIRVNLVVLGHVWSDPFDGLTGGNRAHADTVVADLNLIGRVADPAEVAAMVAFVASPAAAYVTGAELSVDGGYGVLGPEKRVPLMPLLMGEG